MYCRLFNIVFCLVLGAHFFSGKAIGQTSHFINFLGMNVPRELVLSRTGEKLSLQGYSANLLSGDPIFVGALFTVKLEKDPSMLILNNLPAAMCYYFVRESVAAEFVKRAFTEELLINNPEWEKDPINARRLIELQTMLDREYQAGDCVVFEYSADDYLTMKINADEVKLWKNSRSLFNALLRTWVGPYPPSREFKEAILGK